MHSPKKLKGPRPVKMILSGKSYHEVKELLNVSHSFISEQTYYGALDYQTKEFLVQ